MSVTTHSKKCRTACYRKEKREELEKKLRDSKNKKERDEIKPSITRKRNINNLWEGWTWDSLKTPGDDDYFKQYSNVLRHLNVEKKTFTEIKDFLQSLDKEECPIPELIYELLNNEHEIEELYKTLFENYNDIMAGWVKNYRNISFLLEGELAGALTFKTFELFNQKYACISLLVVKQSFQGNKIGSKLVKFMIETYGKICLYSDNAAIGFYEKLGFKRNTNSLRKLYNYVDYEKDATFMTIGI